MFRLTNSATTTAAVELKLWLDSEAFAPISLVNVGADGTVQLPAAFDQDFGPFALFPVTSAWPRGAYEVGCRVLHPVTGKTLSESVAPFDFQ